MKGEEEDQMNLLEKNIEVCAMVEMTMGWQMMEMVLRVVMEVC